ncbi:MAG: tetratricopeptide repeat protein [Pseudomonadota bacterium]
MSLINQMLQDLETRRAIDEQAGLPNDVRSLPITRTSVAPKILLGGVALAVLASGAYWWAQVRSSVDQYPGPMPQVITHPQVVAPRSSPVASANIPAPVQMPKEERSRANSAPIDASVRQTPSISSAIPEATRGQFSGLKSATVHPPLPQTPVLPITGAEAMSTSAVSPLPSPAVTKSNPDPVVINKQVRLATANDKAENEYRKAMTVLNQGQVDEAISGLRAALREDATHSNARQALAGLFIEQRRLEEAQGVLQEGLAQNSAQPNMAIKLAHIQVERGDIKGANETLQQSAVAGTNNAEYRAFSAGVSQRLGDHPAAINEYQAALRLAPYANIWWMGLGISLDADGKKAEARDAFQKARAGGALSPDLDQFVEQKLRQLQ